MTMDNESASPKDESIFDGLNQAVAPPGISPLYTFGLVLVTVVMIVLPLIYLALIGLAGYGVYYHAVHHWDPIMANDAGASSGRAQFLKFLIYATPLFVGGVVLLFLVKPLFAKKAPRSQPMALNRDSEPLLFEFIDRLCRVVGAPAPKRIDVDCHVNASASFRRGFLSFLGNDLVLTLGLPLVANLSTRELAGVIAHEFGHFAQGMGMRLSYLIRGINFWFARVVFERDAWDVALIQWSRESQDLRVTLILGIARFGVWFSRLFLHGLMLVGHAVSSFMLRQMEYDADAYEIKVSGSKVFEQTTHKLATLDEALGEAYKELRDMWNQTQHLPDNFPEILRRHHRVLGMERVEQTHGALGLQKTGLLDTHPAPADRIRKAQQAKDRGVYREDRPATELFHQFETPSRFVTHLHYTDDLGIPIGPSMLTPVEEVPLPTMPKPPDMDETGSVEGDASNQFFMGLLSLLLPLRVPLPLPRVHQEEAQSEMRQVSGQVGDILVKLEPALADHRRVRRQRVLVQAAEKLLDAGAAFDPRPLGMREASREAVEEALHDYEESMEALTHSLREVVAALNRRFLLGLALAAGTDLGKNLPRVARLNLDLTIQHLNDFAVAHAGWKELETSLELLHCLRPLADQAGAGDPARKALALQAQTVRDANAIIAERSKLRAQASPLKVRPAILQTEQVPELDGIPDIENELVRWKKENIETINSLASVAMLMEHEVED